MQDFKQLKVWQKSYQLGLDIYQATSSFPKEETFGLTSQMRRSCVSIAANIAEGCGRKGKAEFVQFLHIAIGSASELEHYLLFSHDLGMLNKSSFEKLTSDIHKVKKMLITLIKKLQIKNNVEVPKNCP